MTSPAVVEKTCVDIDLSNGINESERVETMDWQKYLYRADNVVIDQSGALITRPGLTYIATDSATSRQRLLAFEDGLGYITNTNSSLAINQFNESSVSNNAGGRIPELCIAKAHSMGSWGAQLSAVGSPGRLEAIGYTSKYFILVHQAWTDSSTTIGHQVVIRDRESGSIVRVYSRPTPTHLNFCVVGGRYLHFFETTSGVISKFWQLDTNNLPTDLSGVSTVNLAAGGTAVVIDCLAISTTESVVITDLGTDTGMEKFGTAGTSTGSGTLANNAGKCLANSQIGVANNTNTTFFIAGISNGGKYRICKITSSSLATAETITDSTATTTLSTCRLATDQVNLRLVAYGAYASTSTINIPYIQIWSAVSGSSSTLTHVANINGWVEQGLPIYSNSSARFYLPVMKFNTGNSGTTGVPDTVAGATAVVDITALTSDSGNKPGALRIAGLLDEYVDAINTANTATGIFGSLPKWCPYRPIDNSGGYYQYFAHQYKATNSSYGFEILEVIKGAAQFISCDTDVISGGMLFTWDGLRGQELGFVETPIALATISSSGTGLTALGIYNWFAVYEYKDLKGKSHYSRCSIVSSATVGAAAKDGIVEVTIPVVTMHDRIGTLGSAIRILLYRTASGGTQYYLTKNISVVTTSLQDTIISITDDTTDALLTANAVPFRNPGTIGTALDRYHALAANHVVRHKDRVFYAKGNKVYYSSFAVDGEAPWFNPAFSIYVPGGTGSIVGLASMDGTLVVFKRNAVFLIDGDGPPENGGNGTDFSSPRRLNTDFGCTDARSIVTVPDGIMYKSQVGIYLLTRNGQAVFVGQNVMKTTDTNPSVGGSAFDRKNGRIYFPCHIRQGPDGVNIGSTSGVTCIYDIVAKAWTTATFTNYIQDACFVSARVSGSTPDQGQPNSDEDNLIFCDTTNGLYQSDPLVGYDTDYAAVKTWATWTIETGYVHSQSKQDRVQVTDLLMLARRSSAHGIVGQNSVDYAESFSTIRTFSESEITALTTIEQLKFAPAKELVQSIRFKITSTAPSVYGTGRQLELFGLTVRLGIKGGGAKLSVAQK